MLRKLYKKIKTNNEKALLRRKEIESIDEYISETFGKKFSTEIKVTLNLENLNLSMIKELLPQNESFDESDFEDDRDKSSVDLGFFINAESKNIFNCIDTSQPQESKSNKGVPLFEQDVCLKPSLNEAEADFFFELLYALGHDVEDYTHEMMHELIRSVDFYECKKSFEHYINEWDDDEVEYGYVMASTLRKSLYELSVSDLETLYDNTIKPEIQARREHDRLKEINNALDLEEIAPEIDIISQQQFESGEGVIVQVDDKQMEEDKQFIEEPAVEKVASVEDVDLTVDVELPCVIEKEKEESPPVMAKVPEEERIHQDKPETNKGIPLYEQNVYLKPSLNESEADFFFELLYTLGHDVDDYTHEMMHELIRSVDFYECKKSFEYYINEWDDEEVEYGSCMASVLRKSLYEMSVEDLTLLYDNTVAPEIKARREHSAAMEIEMSALNQYTEVKEVDTTEIMETAETEEPLELSETFLLNMQDETGVEIEDTEDFEDVQTLQCLNDVVCECIMGIEKDLLEETMVEEIPETNKGIPLYEQHVSLKPSLNESEADFFFELLYTLGHDVEDYTHEMMHELIRSVDFYKCKKSFEYYIEEWDDEEIEYGSCMASVLRKSLYEMSIEDLILLYDNTVGPEIKARREYSINMALEETKSVEILDGNIEAPLELSDTFLEDMENDTGVEVEDTEDLEEISTLSCIKNVIEEPLLQIQGELLEICIAEEKPETNKGIPLYEQHVSLKPSLNESEADFFFELLYTLGHDVEDYTHEMMHELIRSVDFYKCKKSFEYYIEEWDDDEIEYPHVLCG